MNQKNSFQQKSSVEKINVLWITAGLGCDSESVAITAATQPSIEDIVMGGLSGVVKDALLFSWEIACQGTPLAGSRLEIEEIPVVVFCANCRENKTLGAVNIFFCPVCHAPASQILQGRELEVTALEIV